MKGYRLHLLTVLCVAVIMGCGSDHGTDSLFSRAAGTGTTISRCTQCHNASVSPGLDPLLTNGSGTAGKHVRHVQVRGIDCERCHNGYFSTATHMDGALDTENAAVQVVYFDFVNPSGAWINDVGPGTGTCSLLYCHNYEPLDWYGTNTWSLPPCDVCHSTAIGLRRAVTGTGGDFGQNAALLSHHVTGTSDPTPAQCQVCHEMSQHMGGGVRLKHADTGTAVAYDPSNPGTLEPFCLSCHDATGAAVTFASGGTPTTPFNDSSIMGQAPNRASIEIADQWNRTFGHRQQGLTCLGNGMPGTGCHGNGHGTSFVGLLARNLALPSSKSGWYTAADEPDYDLCFTCHDLYSRVSKEAVLGMRMGGNYQLDLADWGAVPAYAISGIQTLFRDVNLGTTGKAYDDPTFFSSAHENLHMYHLQIGPAWSYRSAVPSSIVCVTCHSVHGSNTQWGWVHDSLAYGHFVGAGGDQYGMIGAPLASLGNYPTSCTFNCHNIFGTTHSWFEPSDE